LLFLFSESDLTTTGVDGYADFTQLRMGTVLDPQTANVRLPELYADVLHSGMEQTRVHQSTTGRWRAFIDTVDRRMEPGKMVYQALDSDTALRTWQQTNCP
jgi:hypothetical protein